MSDIEKLSATAIRVGEFVYLFDTEEQAEAFLECLASEEVNVCEDAHKPDRVHISEYTPDDDDNNGGGKLRM